MFASRNSILCPTPKARTTRLAVQPLEAREVMSTMIVLDFNGVSNADLKRTTAAVGSPSALTKPAAEGKGLTDFIAGFASLNADYNRYRFLDFTGNGTISTVDADRAAGAIMERVRDDYAPYDVVVRRADSTSTALSWMKDNRAEDAYVFVNGDDGAGGQANLDLTGKVDNAMTAGGSVGVAKIMADGLRNGTYTVAQAREAYLNMLTSFVSHEAGHSLGLDHVVVSQTPGADDRNLMDPFLWDRNTGFWDVNVVTETSGTQNQHRLLTARVGASTRPWAAVLKPGELTVQGGGYNDAAAVTETAPRTWTVQTAWTAGTTRQYRNYMLDDSAAPGFNSMNQFTSPIGKITFAGGAGNDRFQTSVQSYAAIVADGGLGNDTLYAGRGSASLTGGTGNDTLVGNISNDTLVGGAVNDVLSGFEGHDLLNGGTGTDSLFGGVGFDVLWGGTGNDLLDGGADNDALYGGTGRDTLKGGDGNDYLDGTEDNTRDLLVGGTGADTFVRYKDTFLGITIDEEIENEFDFLTGTDVRVTH